MIRKLNFSKAPMFDFPELLVLIKPLGSMLTRVGRLPEGLLPSKEKELEEVLNTLCKRRHLGIWYFDLRESATRQEIEDILGLMGIMSINVQLDVSPTLSN